MENFSEIEENFNLNLLQMNIFGKIEETFHSNLLKMENKWNSGKFKLKFMENGKLQWNCAKFLSKSLKMENTFVKLRKISIQIDSKCNTSEIEENFYPKSLKMENIFVKLGIILI